MKVKLRLGLSSFTWLVGRSSWIEAQIPGHFGDCVFPLLIQMLGLSDCELFLDKELYFNIGGLSMVVDGKENLIFEQYTRRKTIWKI